MRWHSPAEALTWRELEGELVVHNARTGSTHLLAPFAGGLLRALIEADAGLSVEDPASQEVLTEFQQLGLAEPEAP